MKWSKETLWYTSNHSVQQELAEKILGSSGISTKSANLDRLLAWVRDRYWYHLLIFDNCDDAVHYQNDDFQAVLRKIIQTSKSVNILITSRKEVLINQVSIVYPISELSTEAACEMLKSREQHGAKLTTDQRRSVANLTGNVPLALDIFKLMLNRTGAPSPDELIRELEKEIIETLSPSDLCSSLRIKAVIDLSYRHLDPNLQKVGRQLTIFPGSFRWEAGVFVLGHSYGFYDAGNHSFNISMIKGIDRSFTSLLRNSLLQYDQRMKRFQYHQLIRKYFHSISTPNDTNELLPIFNAFYASLLKNCCDTFRERFDLSVVIVDAERHNFHKLLRNLQTMHLSAADGALTIYRMADAVSKSVETELLTLRFPRDDLIAALKNALVQFDLVVERDTPSLRMHYDQPSAEFFHCYILMMTQLTELTSNDNSRWSNICAIRERNVKAWQDFIDPMDYSMFYQQLSRYYDKIGNGKKVKECRRNVFVHASVHHHMCTHANEAQCTYDNIGIAYYNAGKYYMAAEVLEKAIEMEVTNALNRAKLLGI